VFATGCALHCASSHRPSRYPESELAAAERFLHYLRATADPVLRALLEAPLDDDPETGEEGHAVQEAREELARGEVRTLEEVRRELGV
jgi:hypothetical protein